MSQRDKSPPVWGNDNQKANTSSASVSSNDERNLSINSLGIFPIDLLPLEILYMIIETLDAESLVNCMHVSQRWKSVCFRLANGDKTSRIWESIFKLYHEEDTFSTKSCGLPYKDLLANLISWNLDFSSISIYGTCWVNYIKKITIYRDNIIVVDFEGVKYFDVYKHNIKKRLEITDCLDFVERDAFVLRITEIERADESQIRLLLYGKTTIYDDGYELVMQNVMDLEQEEFNHENAILISGLAHYTFEKNCCYAMNAFSCVLTRYTWKDNKWDVCNMGRYYGNQSSSIYAMNVLNNEILLLTKLGQLISHCYEQRNFQEVHRVRLPTKKNVYIKMVHKYCIVIGVSNDSEFRITRIRNNAGYIYYKFECPNLSCSTQHGEMLFLGFHDGKVEIFMPKTDARKDMLKHRLHLADYASEPLDPQDRIVISIDVYEDFGRHFLFISTYSAVHHLVIELSDDICVWDNIPKIPVFYKYPILTKYSI